jgi:hypothetical protein
MSAFGTFAAIRFSRAPRSERPVRVGPFLSQRRRSASRRSSILNCRSKEGPESFVLQSTISSQCKRPRASPAAKQLAGRVIKQQPGRRSREEEAERNDLGRPEFRGQAPHVAAEAHISAWRIGRQVRLIRSTRLPRVGSPLVARTPYRARKGGPSLDDNGTNPTRNPKGLPIRSSVSTVGLASPRSISASCLRVKRKRAANCCWDIPRACLIATIASGSFSRPIRASSAISVRLARISSFDGFVHRAILQTPTVYRRVWRNSATAEATSKCLPIARSMTTSGTACFLAIAGRDLRRSSLARRTSMIFCTGKSPPAAASDTALQSGAVSRPWAFIQSHLVDRAIPAVANLIGAKS